HYALWNAGIHHRDVSPANLMYYRRDDANRTVGGCLERLRPCIFGEPERSFGVTSELDKIPFMAIDLLEAPGQDGKVKHLYRHDMESFIWVFVWIC
ncbi:hypothetical protein BU15DRAFT_31356, partial [Melanogaster broomeanus]